MGDGKGKLTVFFEEPFWVGVFERYEDGKLSVAKVTFGEEPKDYYFNHICIDCIGLGQIVTSTHFRRLKNCQYTLRKI